MQHCNGNACEDTERKFLPREARLSADKLHMNKIRQNLIGMWDPNLQMSTKCFAPLDQGFKGSALASSVTSDLLGMTDILSSGALLCSP